MVALDIDPKPEGVYRLAVWTVGPSVERKYPRLVALDADVVVMPRVGSEARLLKAGRDAHTSMAWVGRYPQRGLGVIAFGQSHAKLDASRWDQRLEWVAPVQVSGVVPHQLLAVWALHEKARVKFKTHPPASQTIQMMRLYGGFMKKPTVVAGDFNNNPMFHRNDPNWDMLELVALLEAAGLRSVYHHVFEIEHGDPRELPTRIRPGPEGTEERHHVDYCFVPEAWLPTIERVQVGSPDVWARSSRSESHVPLVIDFDLQHLHLTNRVIRSVDPS